MEKPKLKKSKTLSINIHEIELKAFSIYTRRRIPGISCSSVKWRMSYIRRVLGSIHCVPKGDKPRQFMKNWRPISLLNILKINLLLAALLNGLSQFYKLL
jgi:hypothetical protein